MKTLLVIAGLWACAHLAQGQTVLQQPATQYSVEARAAGLEGTAWVMLDIGVDGTPGNARIEEPELGLGLDEIAIEAAKQKRFPAPPPVSSVVVGIDFLLPSKLSRWHLVGVLFQPPEGASRPIFLTEPYPLGAGVSSKALDEGAVIAAIRRSASVTLEFDMDEHGVPAKFQVLAASDDIWGAEAIAVVRKWRFAPGMQNGNPVPVPCTLNLVWGQKVWTSESLAKALPYANPAHTRAGRPPKIRSIRQTDDATPHSPYSVILSVTIREDGVAIIGNVIRTIAPEYDQAAIDAVRQSHFEPAVVNGTALPLPAFIEVDF